MEEAFKKWELQIAPKRTWWRKLLGRVWPKRFRQTPIMGVDPAKEGGDSCTIVRGYMDTQGRIFIEEIEFHG